MLRRNVCGPSEARHPKPRQQETQSGYLQARRTCSTIHESVFLADTATIIGRVTLEENASV